jgi:hypothetical protein
MSHALEMHLVASKEGKKNVFPFFFKVTLINLFLMDVFCSMHSGISFSRLTKKSLAWLKAR